VDAQIAASGAVLGFVVAYGALLKRHTLDLLEHGWFNLHYSLLPAYRGAAPVQHALLNGESATGATIFKLDEGMDTGEIYAQIPTVIEPGENAGDLLERLTSIGLTIVDEFLPSIAAGTAKGKAQTGEDSDAGNLTRTVARLTFENEATSLENKVRAFNPEPMAWCDFGGAPLRILAARATNHEIDGELGSCILESGRVLVKCAIGALELTEVQPAGKSVMSAADWLRGQREAVVLR
jgi:methionyl-tRNA formyltransferase